LTYNPQLDTSAQALAVGRRLPNDYPGAIVAFRGAGDPEPAALNDAYKKGAGPWLSRCDYTEIGASFYRVGNQDYVGIAFGKP
jgi:hypothetical protein